MELICVNCPRGCRLSVGKGENGEVKVSGYGCPRGLKYGETEFLDPVRTVTGLVRLAGMRRPLPVKTSEPVPKARMYDVLAVMRQTTTRPPVSIGDTIVENVAGTGASLVATANIV